MKKIFILLIFVALIVSVSQFRGSLARGASNSTDWLSFGLAHAGSRITKTFSFIGTIRHLRRQNQELSDKILSFEVDRSRIFELEQENEILKKEIKFASENPQMSLIPTRIIGREPVSFLDYIMVDKGQEDGVSLNQAVISQGVMVGQVSEVFNHKAKVTLITSKSSLILAMLQNSRSKGILKGGISGLALDNITQDVSYETGENIVTSGLDGELAPGMLIGKAGKIISNSSELFKSIAVDPIIDLSKLELVFIVK